LRLENCFSQTVARQQAVFSVFTTLSFAQQTLAEAINKHKADKNNFFIIYFVLKLSPQKYLLILLKSCIIEASGVKTR
jgi:hypothetical protein